MYKKILITGSDGLLGCNITNYFLSQGHSVIGVDNQTRYGNIIREHHYHKNFKFIVGSVLDINSFDLPSDIDFVIHCAYEAGGINWWNHNEEDYYSRNRSISQSMIEFLLSRPEIEKIVWFSSSQVYENEDVFPTPELSADNLYPSSGYAREKLESERQIVNSILENRTIIVRPFNVIGKEEIYIKENQRAHVVVDIAIKIMECEGLSPIEIQGSGLETRTFTTSEDLVSAIALLIEKIRNGVYNICGIQELSMLALSKIMWSLSYTSTPKIRCQNNSVDRDVVRRIGSTEKLIKETSWLPKNDLENHLKDILKEIKSE